MNTKCVTGSHVIATPSMRARARIAAQAAKHSSRSTMGSNGNTMQTDSLIVPQTPQSSSRAIAPRRDRINSSSSNGGGGDSGSEAVATTRRASRHAAKPNLRHDSRRSPLVKIRVAPRRYRLRESFDQPRRIHVDPLDPSFEGRMTSEINGTYGPRQLAKLIEDFGPYFTASHCAAAISLLAGMSTGKQLQQQDLQATYQAPAAQAADYMTARMKQASMIDCARAVYGLSRLQLHMPQLLSAVTAHSRDQLRTAPPQALAGLAAGLAHWAHRPGEAWVDELCMEAFAQMSGFGAQDLANLLFSLAMWQKSVSQPFLLRCLTAFRGHWGSAGCHAPTLVRFIYALTQLPPCQPLPEGMLQLQPEGAAVYIHHEEWRQQKQAQEISRVISTAGESTSRQQQQQQQDGYSGNRSVSSSSSSSNQNRGKQRKAAAAAAMPATYRLPSFNWITAFLAECRRQIDRMKPAELSTLLWCMACLNHTPDLIFMEAWYRASAAHMHAFKPHTLAMALQALGMLQPGRDLPGGISGRWLQAVLQHSQQLLGQCSGPELVKLLWGFAELRFWPGQGWMDEWTHATQVQLHTLQPSDVSDVIWALARLRYTPPTPWMQTLGTAVTQNLTGFSAQGLAVVIWGFTRLELKPERQWLLQFKAASGSQFNDESAQKLAKFVAGVLAQQNRQRFANAGHVQRGDSGRAQ